MSGGVAFAYAQARLQAHHGRRPGPEVWQQLEAIADFGHFVQTARNTGLRPWVQHAGPQSGADQVELSLRERFRRHVRRVAAWQPRDWAAAVDWALRLPDLPGLQHLLQDRPTPGWMERDPVFARYLQERSENRRAALRGAGDIGPLVRDWEGGRSLPEAWRERWHALWPKAPRAHRIALYELEALMRNAQDRLERERAAEAAQVWPRGEELEASLVRMFRRRPQQPAAAFAHLALVWLDLARLRGGLVRRRLGLQTG